MSQFVLQHLLRIHGTQTIGTKKDEDEKPPSISTIDEKTSMTQTIDKFIKDCDRAKDTLKDIKELTRKLSEMQKKT